MLGIYVHIPFCERKCSYCAFSSFVSSMVERERYVQALINEIKDFANKNRQEKFRNVDTIFIGGGTPSLLEIDLFERVIIALKENFVFSDDLEFTIECNPNSLTEEKLDFYQKMGINRISIGVQSLDDDELKFVGRLHDKRKALEAIKMSLKHFENVSVDLLIGIKDMDKEKYLKNLETLVDLGVKHISTYMLQVEKGTPLADLVQDNFELLPSDEDCICVYDSTVQFLKGKGFEQYEVSNFAKEGYECRHNVKYWTGEDYIGFGLSAHSYTDGTRFARPKNFDDYYQGKIALKEKLTTEQLIEEHIMLGLRCNNGVDVEYLKKLGYDIETNDNFQLFINKGVLSSTDNRIFLNPQYYGVNNFIIVQLLPF